MVYENIIMSGGGSKTCSMLGALSCLKEHQLLDKVNNFMGVSAASILLLLVTIDLDLVNIFHICNELNTVIQNLNNQNIVESIIFENGLSKGNDLIYFLNKVLYQEINIKNPTFLELYKITQKKLSVVITNLSLGKLEIFSYENYPNFKVTEAIRMSCGLPFLFTSVLIFEIKISYKVYNTIKNNSTIKNNFTLKNNSTIKNNDNNYGDNYYISSLSPHFIGFCNDQKRIKISIIKQDIDFDKLIGLISYSEKKWIFYNFNYLVTVNNKPVTRKSCILNIGDIININNQVEINFQKINIYADGAIIDNFPIQLSEKLKGQTLGITMKYENVNDKKVRNEIIFNENILSYLNRIKDCTINTSYVEKLKKYKDIYITINIPNNLSIYNFTLKNDEIKKIIKNGHMKTNHFLQKKNLKLIKNNKLILLEVNSSDVANLIIKNRKKITNQLSNINIGLYISNDKIKILKKYQLYFPYIISCDGNFIIKNQMVKLRQYIFREDKKKYNNLMNQIIKLLNNLPSNRDIYNYQFIVEFQHKIHINPFGNINNLNNKETEKVNLDSCNKEIFLHFYDDAKNLLSSSYLINYDYNNYSIIIKPLTQNFFVFLNNLSEEYNEFEIYLNNTISPNIDIDHKLNNINVKIKKLSLILGE